MKKLFLFLFAILTINIAFAQSKEKGRTVPPNPTGEKRIVVEDDYQFNHNLPATTRDLFSGEVSKMIPQSFYIAPKMDGLQAVEKDALDRVICIKGELKNQQHKSADLNQQVIHYLNTAAPILEIENPETEFELVKMDEEQELKMTHHRFQQQYKGVPIFGAEVILHSKNGVFQMLNGKSFPTPELDVTPTVELDAAIKTVETHLTEVEKIKYTKDIDSQYIDGDQIKSELKIYFPKGTKTNPTLAWHISIYANIMHRYEYIIDAHTNEVLFNWGSHCAFTHHKFDESLKEEGKEKNYCNHDHEVTITPSDVLDGPAVASARDLNGVMRTLNTYQIGAAYYMIDAIKPMFNQSSQLPNKPLGTIWTVDGNGGTPMDPNNFNARQMLSGSNAWNDRRAVSAHYNGEITYDYFRTVHGRKSVNDQNGNIWSFIDIKNEDGSDMDNAFWNGRAIFYGNGNVAFDTPFSAGLDVSGHEVAHGVVQTSANLDYFEESGALNESFADIFGAMMDRDDWLIGEDIVSTRFFPSGAMRDMSNPNNGAQPGTNPYQPDHYDQRYIGREDAGGVHINSGIPNYAYYLFATNPGVGKEVAEKVFYRALDKYLVASSQFVDLRVATMQAAGDLYGSTVQSALNDALNQVGIPGGSGNDFQNDLDENDGRRFMIFTDLAESKLILADEDGNILADPFVQEEPAARVSVTDDGSFAVFVNKEGNMFGIDFAAGQYQQISTLDGWRSVAVSKDGTKLAALTDDYDNQIFVRDLANQSNWQGFRLYNPTFTAGVESGDVQYADIIEWDYSGGWVMYDATSKIESEFGEVNYWDIGFLNVWENGDFSDGRVQKLFTNLPENISIGNPTFSKLSPYIIAFDFHEEGESYDLMTMNIQTGDISDPPLFESGAWNFPSFTMDDKSISFDAMTNQGNDVIALQPISTDKLSTSGNASIFVPDGTKGVWYANGQRDVTSTENIGKQEVMRIFPNPSEGMVNLYLNLDQKHLSANVTDLLGRTIRSQKVNFGNNSLNLNDLEDGTYFISIIENGAILQTQRVVIVK